MNTGSNMCSHELSTPTAHASASHGYCEYTGPLKHRHAADRAAEQGRHADLVLWHRRYAHNHVCCVLLPGVTTVHAKNKAQSDHLFQEREHFIRCL